MDKFYKWLNKKNIILYKDDEMSFWLSDNHIGYDIDEFGSGRIDIPEQMLIGYRIEYLMKNNKKYKNQNYYLPRCAEFKDVSGYLKLKINQMEKRNETQKGKRQS